MSQNPVINGAQRIASETLMTDPNRPEIAWEHDWDAALVRARQERRLLLIDVEKAN